MQPTPEFRPAVAADLAEVQRTLYLALSWDPDDPIPPFDAVVHHPEIAKYHAGWIRPGDAGVVAEVNGECAGMAYYRLFTDEDHGQGFFDAETPEVAIAVLPRYRGLGIGTALMNRLADTARADGFRRLSLSVSSGNPASRLYARLGYERVAGKDELMVLDLG